MLTVVLAVVGGTVVVPLVAVVPEGAVLVGAEGFAGTAPVAGVAEDVVAAMEKDFLSPFE